MEQLSPNSRKIIFNISATSFIEIVLPCKLKDLYRYEDIEIFFIYEDKNYSIFKFNFLFYALEAFKALLEESLSYNLYLNTSINKDVGYLWNEYLNDVRGNNLAKQEMDKDSDLVRWVGQKYLLWSSPRDYTTWLYNKNESIYFEVTPTYKWHFDDPEKGENFVTYKKWIKSYEPIAIIELKREVAQELLKETEKILKFITENDKRNLII